MKKLSILFLYFFICFSVNFNSNIQAQQAKDSIRYYYDMLIQSKSDKDLFSAFKFFNQKKKENILNKDTLSAIQNLRYISSIQKKLGVFYKSEETVVEALQLLNLIKDNKSTNEARVGLYNDLGIIYRNLRNYKKALEYYDKSLNLNKSPQHRNVILNNIAYIYKEQKNYPKALKAFKNIYQNKLKFNNEKQIARSLSNLGFVKGKANIPSALKDLKEALEIRKRINYTPGIVASYLHLAEYYKDKSIKHKAIFYADKVLKIGIVQKNINYQLDALSLLVQLKGDSDVLNYKKLKDSIAITNQLKENKFAAFKYDYSQAIIDAKVKELEAEKEKSKKILYQSIGLGILLLSLFLFYVLRIRYKKNMLQEVYNTETRISKKVHDEVANDVYHVMTKLQSSTNINEELLDDLEGIYTKTRDISKENSILNVHEDFHELLKDLLLSYKSNTTNVITRNISKVDWQRVSDQKKTSIFRVLQELMTNMKKHSKSSLVVLTFSHSNRLIIKYSDNGLGCVLKKNTGLQNVENRIKSINGTIIFESQINNGFKAKITM